MGESQRVPSSPKQSQQQQQQQQQQCKSGSSTTCNYALAILRRFDANARVSGVVKVAGDATVVKLHPGESLTASHQHLAALAALRVAFPFCTVSAVENASSGDTEFQILVSTDGEAFRNARAHYSQLRSFRALHAASNCALLLSLVSFGCLLHASVMISHAPPV